MDIEAITEQDILASRFSGGGFALCRLPGEDSYIYMAQRTAPSVLTSYEELTGRQGVVIAPFVVTEETPVVFLTPDVEVRRPVPEFLMPPVSLRHDTSAQRECYKAGFNLCLDSLLRGVSQKIVYSRRLNVTYPKKSSPNPVHLFWEACRWHPHCYVSLWWTAQTGCWLVATPEILLASDDGVDWKTMALAGTRPVEEAFDIASWDTKNKEEQKYVSRFIIRQLNGLISDRRISATYPSPAGNIAHLRTDIDFKLKPGVSVGKILARLHPTPAVCGIPRSAVRRFIVNTESTPRRYYAGFSGLVGWEGRTQLYVSLRCMELAAGHALLYAGSGLLKSSEAKDEWQETCRKLQPMLQLFGAKNVKNVF